MGVQFNDLDKDVGLKKFNGYLTGKSYVEGYCFSTADQTTFTKCVKCPVASKYPHAFRWYMHVASLLGVRVALVQDDCTADKKVEKKKQEESDDDDDMFGDDDEEDEEEAKAAAKKRADAAKATKVKKVVVERSQVVLEVKPWEAGTDLEELAGKIKATTIEGLKWGEGHKLVPVAFGIKKLLVQCIIIDSMVLLDDITDKIEEFEDYVQSVDVASMNKM